MSRSPMRRALPLATALLLALGLCAGLLVSCEREGVQPDAGPTGPASPSGRPTEPAPTPQPGEPTPQASQALTLTLWTTEAFSPTQATPSGQILAAEGASLSGLRLQFVLKQPYGQGGIVRYLLNTGAVVPHLLPDLAYVDVDEVGELVRAGLARPLDALLSPDLVAELYPFAREACTFEGRLHCLQIQADLDHLVYNSFRLSRPPASWAEVLSKDVPYVFPAGGAGGLVNDAFLAQYAALRPGLDWTWGAPSFLDEPSLVAVLQFYRDGASQGLFPQAVLEFHTTDDSWQAYRSGSAAIAQVSARRYLAEGGQAVFARPAPIPSIGGPAAPISRGWALVLIANEPSKQAAALRFLELWLIPATHAAWNEAAGFVPTLQSALDYWDGEDGYYDFLREQLESAWPRPAWPGFSQVAAALQEAVEAVLTNERSPEEAASDVMRIVP